MPTNTPQDYSTIQTLCNILMQYASSSVYNQQQVSILTEGLAALHEESFEAESLRSQLENSRIQGTQAEAAEIAAIARLKTAVNALNSPA
jgi:hypothetical protein